MHCNRIISISIWRKINNFKMGYNLKQVHLKLQVLFTQSHFHILDLHFAIEWYYASTEQITLN